MYPPKTSNFVYYTNEGKPDQTKSEDQITNDKLQKILQTLSKYAMKEKSPKYDELESLLQNAISENEKQDSETKSENEEQPDQSGSSLTKYLPQGERLPS